MIKNIIFDLGRVLLSFEPLQYLQKRYGDGEKTRILYQSVFNSASWLDLDRGIIDEKQALTRMEKEAGFPEEVRYLLYHWDEMLQPMEQSIRALYRLNKFHYELFLLSNFHKRAYEKVYHRYSFFQVFDGIVISSDTGFIKPDAAIYQKLMKDFFLIPHESLFIDDTPVNVSVAKELGMQGIVFENAVQLRRELKARGVREDG